MKILLALFITHSIQILCADPIRPWFDNDDVKRCKGMPCEVWDATQDILKSTYRKPNQTFDVTFSNMIGATSNTLPGAEGTIEGDIWPTLEQAKALKKHQQTRHKRKLTYFTFIADKWDLPIKYYIDSSFSEEQADAIVGATHHYEAQTCIRFKRLTLYEAIGESGQFLYFVKSQAGCGTYIGRVLIAHPQVIQLEDKCIEQWGAIVHEIGHTIGFWHEHQRSDRDDYVTIFPDRMIALGDPHQYNMGQTRDLLPYDYGSVMHYWAWAFTTSLRNITIQPKDLRYLYTIGQKTGLSFLDSKLANMEYCSAECSYSITCRNKGYQNPNNCHECTCPDGYEGTYCENIASSKKATCGGTIKLGAGGDGYSAYIKSPNYDDYNNDIYYEDRTECTWLIEVPQGFRVSLLFLNRTEDHFGMYCLYPVCFHWVEVKTNSSDLSVTGHRYCCERLGNITAPSILPGELRSEGRQMMIIMRANFTSNATLQRLKAGFRAYVWPSLDTDLYPPAPTQQHTVAPPDTTVATSPQPSIGDNGKVDVIFVMDSSGSVGRQNWERVKDFTKDIISAFNVGSQAVQFGFVTFGSTGYTDIRLNQYEDKQQLLDKITSLQWTAESSNIADGLRAAREELHSSANRPHARNLVILLTDGPASAGQSRTESEATKLRAIPDTTLMIIGVTRVDEQQIDRMASKPLLQNVIQMNSFYRLEDFVGQVTSVISTLGGSNSEQATTIMELLDTTTPTTTTEVITTTESHDYNLSCDFESEDFCFMRQEREFDQFDWRIGTGNTPSQSTGPFMAKSGKHYMYIEASLPRKQEDHAIIYTPSVTSTGQYCLTFAYSMFGFHINFLAVNVNAPPGVSNEIWRKTGQQHNSQALWLTEDLPLYLTEKSYISFTAARGKEFSGDIAVDDIKLISGSC